MGVYGHKIDHLSQITVRDKTNYDGCINQLWHPKLEASLSNENNEFVSNAEIETAYNLLQKVSGYSQERVEDHYLYSIEKNEHGTVIGYSFDRMSDRQTLGHKKDRVHLSPAVDVSVEGLLTAIEDWDLSEHLA